MTAATSLSRVPAVDAVRGVAILLMIGYHSCWDLTYFGWASFDLMGNDLWLVARTGILGLFLGLVGVCLVLAHGGGIDWRKVGRRLGVIGLCALAVTGASWWFTPEGLIFFGVLHHVVLASLLGLAFLRLPPAAVALAAGLALGAPFWLALPVFDTDWLAWLGLMSHLPRSNDFVPLLPWFGVVLGGVLVGRLWGGAAARWRWPGSGRAARLLCWGGRNSLAIYMVHQPVLFGSLWLVTTLGLFAPGPGPAPTPYVPQDQAASFLASCQVSCTNAGAAAGFCQGYCGCMKTRLEDVERESGGRVVSLEQLGQDRLMTFVQACQAQRGGS